MTGSVLGYSAEPPHAFQDMWAFLTFFQAGKDRQQSTPLVQYMELTKVAPLSS